MERASDSQTSVSLLCRLGGNPKDGAAWDEFVRRYGPRILQWCRYWKLQDADALDVAQTVLLRVSRQMATFQYDPSRSFRGWLKTVARAAWCDWLQSQHRPDVASGDSRVLESLQSVEARDDLIRRLEEEYDRELLDAASQRVQLRVEPRTWQAFQMLAFEGLSGAEAAEALGMKVGAVFVAKSKVQKMLQDEIRRLEEADLP